MTQGPFLICGMGHVGRQIALLLRRLGHDVVVITQSPREDWLRGAREAGITVLLGDARDSQLLLSAGIERAQALLATTSQDAVNIEIALDALRLRPDLAVVVRIFDQTLAHAIEGAGTFGIRRALGVSTLAAPTLAAALLGSDVEASFTLTADAAAGPDSTLVVGRLGGEPPAGTAGTLLGTASSGGSLFLTTRAAWTALTRPPTPRARESRRSRLRRRLAKLRVLGDIWRNAPAALRSVLGVLLLLIAASVLVFRFGMKLGLVDAFYFIVTTVTTTGYGDITPKDSGALLKLYACLMMILGSAATALLYSLLTDFVINERFRRAFGYHRVPDHGHMIVVGLGNVGFRVREELRRQGLSVVVISRTEDNEFFQAVRIEGPAIVGDGRLPETLLRAGLAGARGLVAATDDDASNLAIALEARRRHPGLPTVVRLLDAEFAGKVRQGLKLPAAFSTAQVAAPTFVAAALYPGARTAIVADDSLLVMCEQEAAPAWQGKSPAEIAALDGVRPLMLLPGTAAEIGALATFLDDKTPIRAGARLLVLSKLTLA